MSSKLIAIAEGQIMGEITYGGGRMVFRYDSAWQESESAFPLSLAMPLVVREHGHSATEAFLWGLLPDNETVLQRWGQRFRVSARNPFRLLEHVGEDCAGAVQFVKPERVDQLLKRSRKPSVSWISDKDLSERMELLVQDAAATRLGGDTGQFSLAGAQPKLALFREEDSGRWGIPEGRTPTTHILKPSTGSFDGQTENEHFCLQLARHLGFVAANSWVMVSGNIPVIVIERYDRVRTGVQVHRIHQEDMCQALGVPPHRKYQNQGGPSAKQIAELLYTQSSDPAEDVGRFADSLILNWLIGGTDGHAKNFSLLLGVNQQVRLAPLYDVASSLPYPQQIQPRKATLALKIGREYRLQRIDRRDWETCARELRLPAKDLLHRIQLLAETLPNAAKETAHQLQSSGITHPVIPKLVDTLGEHCQNCIDALSVF